MKKLLQNIYEAIGETPMLNLIRIVKHYGVDGQIYAKLEFLNPGYSKKDRPALQMIEEAEASGELKPGQPVIELTSGNTGTGLAIVCQAKGHPFIAVMSEGNSTERARMMRALGAEVVLVPQSGTAAKGMVSGKDLEQKLPTPKLASTSGNMRTLSFMIHFQTAREGSISLCRYKGKECTNSSTLFCSQSLLSEKVVQILLK